MVCDLLYSKVVRPLLFRMDCEDAHRFIHETARQCGALWPMLSGFYRYGGSDLACQFAGLSAANPVGLAAGFDKNGDLVEMLGHVGFGFAEIGSVTAQARAGNPKPRLFRLLDDQALINRLGLNGEGADRIATKLRSSKFSLPVGLNIAKTNDPAIVGEAAIEDMLYTFRKIKDLPISYVTINASCPNTQEGILSEVNVLSGLFARMQAENDRRLPVLVKLSPDGSEQLTKDIIATAVQHGLAGYVCGNTSTSRSGLSTPPTTIEQIGNGGLSGPPLKKLALKLCSLVNKLKAPSQIIIACGGITSGDDAYEFICSGASAVQLYTGLVYQGPTLPKKINEELSARLRKDGLSLSDAIGSSATKERSVATTSSN